MLVSISKIVGSTSSGLFAGKSLFIYPRSRVLGRRQFRDAEADVTDAGHTWALSFVTVPTILHAKDEGLILEQWRYQYLMGFYVRPSECTNNSFIC